MSREGFRVLQEHRIPAAYDQEVEMIENRDHTDMCPMEKAVMDIDDPAEAPTKIKETIEKMRKGG